MAPNKLRSSALTVALLTAAVFPVTAQNNQQPAQVVWTNLVNVRADGGSLADTCNGCGNAGAESQQTLTAGDGYVEFTTNTVKDGFTVGIGGGPASTNVNDIEYALRFYANGNVEVRDHGTYLADTRYAPGQRFRIAVDKGDVKYYTQDSGGPRIIHTTRSPELSYPLKVEVAMPGQGTQIDNVVVWGAGNSGGRNLSWTNVDGATANGNTLVASGGSTNAGAQSVESLSGDGWFEFTAQETDKMRAVGLDHQNSNNTFQDIDYAIVLREAQADGRAYAEVWQNGTFISDTPYTQGMRFRIAVENGIVKYYKYENGKMTPIQGTNAQVSNFPLHVDVALYHPQSTIAEVTGLQTTRQQ
jgi:hypothetical protein